LIPLGILSIAHPAVLPIVATLFAALPFPLASLLAKLLFLCSLLLIAQPALFFVLPSLLIRLTLLLLILPFV